ncbi:MAG TPA: hypothetical protein VL294_07250 [Pseudolysinimonas sp.]|jgi:hypothetical protein|nr:hypothetical protein [Pseudolysinimonas sp.]
MSINEPIPPATPPAVEPPTEPAAPDQEPLAPNPSEPDPFVDPEVTP